MNATAHFYTDKARAYFNQPRTDMVALLKTDKSSAILELGCGEGATGALALASGKVGHYTGIELDPAAAAIARTLLREVIEGDVAALDLSAHHGRYDALIASEVFEHLIDPWAVLSKLLPCLKAGSDVMASSPNVAHWRVVWRLIRGRFEHTESGVMDRSHLRWFTPASYRALFEDAGLEILSVTPITAPSWRTRLINGLSGGRLAHLFMVQIMVVARVRAASLREV